MFREPESDLSSPKVTMMQLELPESVNIQKKLKFTKCKDQEKNLLHFHEKDFQTRRSLHLFKENIQPCKTWNCNGRFWMPYFIP
jgi:hypothetical protein